MANIKRQRRTVLTEENLKKFLSIETLKLNLDHHNWLKDSFLAKIGGLAPKLERSLFEKTSNQQRIFHRAGA